MYKGLKCYLAKPEAKYGYHKCTNWKLRSVTSVYMLGFTQLKQMSVNGNEHCLTHPQTLGHCHLTVLAVQSKQCIFNSYFKYILTHKTCSGSNVFFLLAKIHDPVP